MTEDPIRDGGNWYSYCDGNPVRYVDPSGLIGIMPDGSIYMDENDTETDRILLQLKMNYVNAATNEQRKTIAIEADLVRKTTTESYKVLPHHTLAPYIIPDLTNSINALMNDNKEEFRKHKKDYIWFKDHVKTGALVDVKNSNVNFKREAYSYHIIYAGQVMRADAPGNILYGYLGKAAEFSDTVLLYCAGAYQIYEDSNRDIGKTIKNSPRLLDNYGDNKGDSEQIKFGIALYNLVQYINEGL